MTKITKTEKFEMIIKALCSDNTTEMNEETAMLVDFCKDEIAGIQRKAEKAKERRASKAAEADPILDAVADVLAKSDAPYMTINEIISAISDDTLTQGKVTPRLTTMVNSGLVTKATVTTADKRRVQGYTLVK